MAQAIHRQRAACESGRWPFSLFKIAALNASANAGDVRVVDSEVSISTWASTVLHTKPRARTLRSDRVDYHYKSMSSTLNIALSFPLQGAHPDRAGISNFQQDALDLSLNLQVGDKTMTDGVQQSRCWMDG